MHLPTLARLGYFFHHDGMYARKCPLPLCVYSVFRTPGACYEDWRLNRRPSEGEEQELAVEFTGKFCFRKLVKIYLLLKDKIR